MAESSWDSSRKKYRKRATTLLFTGIPLIILCGIIYYNNREAANFSPGGGSAANEPVGAEEEKKAGDSALENRKSPDGSQIRDSVGNPAARQINSKEPPVLLQKHLDSVWISGIEYKPVDRPDVMLKLSLTLFFSDAGLRSEILLRREEIRVIARKLLQGKQLGSIKKETIEPRLFNEIKNIFGNGNLDDVKITDLNLIPAID